MLEWFLIFLLLIVLIVLFAEYSRLRGSIESRAMELFDTWKSREVQFIRESIWKEAIEHAENKARELFSQWKVEAEEAIREDAIKRSLSTIIGKVGEHIAPIVIFSNYGINPKDLRFIGTPVDYVAFKGLSEGKLEEIFFIEVKSGKTYLLTEREKQIKEAVEIKKVKWLLIHLPSEIERLRGIVIKQNSPT